ncbi:MAG: DNA/RNA non-specific endonuclease [Sphingobium sp.]|nr:DNA/RNA non-specific endonuclease [Sphingobium sp.]
MTNQLRGKARHAGFAAYLRTGRYVVTQPRAAVETKFNPWHDREDGKFTFAGSGRYFGQGSRTPSITHGYARPPTREEARSRHVGDHSGLAGGGSGGGGGASGGWQQPELDDPQNYSIYVVKPGDNLTKIARTRRGLRVSDLAWLNGISTDKPIQIGQKLKIPTQAYLEFTRERSIRVQALGLYLALYGSPPVPKSPNDPNFHDINTVHPPSIEALVAATRKTETSNGYAFDRDMLRTWRTFGYLRAGPTAKRSTSAQGKAGGKDRLPNDHGGHFISILFDPPPGLINIFAQNKNFNKSAYRKMEISWVKHLKAGRQVYVDIAASYTGLSQRPDFIRVIWFVDGERFEKTFANEAGGE